MRKRMIVTLLALFLFACLILMLIDPFRHPNTHLAFLSGTDYSLLNLPPIDFAAEDKSKFDQLATEGIFYQKKNSKGVFWYNNMRSPQEMQQLGQRFSKVVTGKQDVVVVYLSGHCISVDNTAYLLCRNFDPQSPSNGRIEIRELLAQISRIPAKEKLLLLDSGRIDFDPRLGVVANNFPKLLEQEVRRNGDFNLWVIHSISVGERSHVSRALNQSVFSYFLTQGLAGAADLDEDDIIRLDELYRYVATNVNHWVRYITADQETQTPVLLWGGNDYPENFPDPFRFPDLISTAGMKNKIKTANVKQSINIARGNSLSEVFNGLNTKDQQPVKLRTAPIREIPSEQSIVGSASDTDHSDTLNKTPTTSDAPTTKANDTQNPSSSPTSKGNGTKKQAAGAAKKTPPKEEKSNPSSPEKANSTNSKSSNEKSNTNTSGDAAATKKKDNAKDAKKKIDPKEKIRQKDSARVQAAKLLIQAWLLRDELASRRHAMPSPVDFAPQLWREYELRLIGLESQLRAGSMVNSKQIVKQLREQILPLSDYLTGKRKPDLNDRSIAQRLSVALPRFETLVPDPSSLALIEFIASQQYHSKMTPEFAVVKQFDSHLQGKRVDFEKWLSERTKKQLLYVEIHLANQLMASEQLDWNAIRRTLRIRRFAEQVAVFDFTATGWIRREVGQADRLRIAAERILLDDVIDSPTQAADELFTKAVRKYKIALENAKAVAAAKHLRNDLLYRIPYYFTWYGKLQNDLNSQPPKHKSLIRTLQMLDELSIVLASEAPANLAKLKSLTNRLSLLRAEIDRGLQNDFLKSMTKLPNTIGDSWRMEAVLSTPLPSARSRIELLKNVAIVERKLASKISLPQQFPQSLPAVTLSPNRWSQQKKRAGLYVALTKYLQKQSTANSPALQQLVTVWDETNNIALNQPQKLNQAFANLGTALLLTMKTEPVRIAQLYQQGQQLANKTVDDSSSSQTLFPKHLAQRSFYRQAQQALTVLDVRDRLAVSNLNATDFLNQSSIYDFLTWHRWRLTDAKDDATEDEKKYLNRLALTNNTMANAIFSPSDLSVVNSASLSIDGPSSLSFVTKKEANVTLQFDLRGVEKADVWILLDYNPKLFSVTGPESLFVFRKYQLTKELGPKLAKLRREIALKRTSHQEISQQTLAQLQNLQQAVSYPLRPDLANKRQTFRMSANQTATLRLHVRSLNHSANSRASQIIVKAIVIPREEGKTINTRYAYQRHQIRVGLPIPPSVDLVISGTSGSWTDSKRQTALHPFANRKTQYTFSLKNRASFDRTFAVELLPVARDLGVQLPVASLTPAQADRYFNLFKVGNPLYAAVDVIVPAGGELTTIGFPQPKEEKQPPPKNTPPLPTLQHGLMLVLKDKQTNHLILKHVRISPQRPRRFLAPKVKYDSDNQRIEISVVPHDPSLIPPGGIQITCDLVGGIPDSSDALTTGRIDQKNREAQMFIEMPVQRGKIVTLRLNVDGWPRAFIYQVPCDQYQESIPEYIQRSAIRINSPKKEAAYGLPRKSLKVQLEMDAPVGSFQNGRDFLEVGIDRNKNRNLNDDPTLKLYTDRQVSVVLKQVAPRGLLTFETTVSDFTVEVPVVGIQNRRAGLLARSKTGDQVTWSRSREIIIDAKGPTLFKASIGATIGKKRVLVQGQPAILRVQASDNALSGVKIVAAVVDIKHIGKFAIDSELSIATQDERGDWVATIETASLKPGFYFLLIRATDQVGNHSQYTKIKVQIVSAKAMAARRDNATNKVLGSLSFGPQKPPNLEVILTPLKKGAVALYSEKTDENGKFFFPKVKTGIYTLTVKGSYKNTKRKLKSRKPVIVTVNPPPTQVPVLHLQIQ